MYCSNCGKDIAQNSNFCMYCGSSQTTDEGKSNRKSVSGSFPDEISDLEFVYDGPSKRKAWIIGDVLRGFSVVFALKDNYKRLTSSDGEVEISVKNLCGKFERTFRVQVTKDEFTNVWVQRSSGNRREFFGYRFYYDKPELVSHVHGSGYSCEAHVEIWFMTPDGRRLHAKNWRGR